MKLNNMEYTIEKYSSSFTNAKNSWISPVGRVMAAYTFFCSLVIAKYNRLSTIFAVTNP